MPCQQMNSCSWYLSGFFVVIQITSVSGMQEAGGNEVSRKGRKGYQKGYHKTKREAQHDAVKNASQFISIVSGKAGTMRQPPSEDSDDEATAAPKVRGKKKKGINELCKWTAMSREQQAMLELFVRKADVRELLVSCALLLS